MRKTQFVLLLLPAIFVLAGCGLSTPTGQPTNAVASPISVTTISSATTQITPLATSTPPATFTATNAPLVPQTGTITVDNFKLRAGPGFLFDTVSLYKEGAILQVFGRSQGNNWLFVSTADSRSGWMKKEYITLSGKLDDLPEVVYPDADAITGHVRNSNGDPMSGIGIIIFSAENSAVSDNTITDDSGSYYLFLPKTLHGNYTIGVNAYSCDSNAVDSQCQLLYGYPSAQSLSLPYTENAPVDFILPAS